METRITQIEESSDRMEDNQYPIQPETRLYSRECTDYFPFEGGGMFTREESLLKRMILDS